MTPAARERAQARMPLLAIAGAAWMVLAMEASTPSPSAHCALDAAFGPAVHGWTLMVAAMMAPLLTAPVHHIRNSSLTRRRALATVEFLAAYLAVWMSVGVVVWAMPLASITVPSAIAGVAWQFSPLKQRCLDRLHRHRALAAFGVAADRDAVRFGLMHGLWCVASCWPLMIAPMLVTRGQLAAMAVCLVWMAAERFARWRISGPIGLPSTSRATAMP
ncbi:MAG TPA: DUF2182 domain-containing protein [Vicinamibacterales bacterium]|nr:DUF2182 domain-containing protein [Vicinamibacterales bacterium]